MIPAAALLLVLSIAPAAGPVVAIPGDDGVCRVRLDVAVAGQPPEVAWGKFLDRLMAFYDRDGNGSLSRVEAERVMPLPLPERKQLAIEFARLDADGDGQASRAELSAYCLRGGFTPVVLVVEPPSADDLRLAALWLRRLDGDGNGKLTPDELRQAPQLLRRYDLDENEYLDARELADTQAGDTRGADAPNAVVQVAEGAADVVLNVDLSAQVLNRQGPSAAVAGAKASTVRLVAAASSDDRHLLHGPANGWAMTVEPALSGSRSKSAGEFLLSQFEAALGTKPALSAADVEQDPALAGLLDLLPPADRNDDRRLELAELRDYLQLVEAGMQAQVWVTLANHGRNPIACLDADGDGRLSYAELARARDKLDAGTNTAGTNKADLPWQFHVSFGGPAVRSWGGVMIPAAPTRAAAKRPSAVAVKESSGPRWFQALDRNGDGVASPREFVGSPELFRKLDADGDGVLTASEADRASNR